MRFFKNILHIFEISLSLRHLLKSVRVAGTACSQQPDHGEALLYLDPQKFSIFKLANET